MSDGPHKSLNMKRHWRKLAQCAQIDAYNGAEVRDAMRDALKSDFKNEIKDMALKEMRKIVDETGSSLFPDYEQRLQAVVRQFPSEPLQQLLVECVKNQLDRVDRAADPVKAAIEDALDIRCARHNKQIEEHYYRAGTRTEGDNIKERLDTAKQGLGIDDLARELCDNTSTPPRKSTKKSGLDEGISL